MKGKSLKKAGVPKGYSAKSYSSIGVDSEDDEDSSTGTIEDFDDQEEVKVPVLLVPMNRRKKVPKVILEEETDFR